MIQTRGPTALSKKDEDDETWMASENKGKNVVVR